MKTSLVIEDRLFREAQKDSRAKGKTISETISHWARVGWETLKNTRKGSKRLRSVDLGGPALVDLSSRRDWMETLDR